MRPMERRHGRGQGGGDQELGAGGQAARRGPRVQSAICSGTETQEQCPRETRVFLNCEAARECEAERVQSTWGNVFYRKIQFPGYSYLMAGKRGADTEPRLCGARGLRRCTPVGRSALVQEKSTREDVSAAVCVLARTPSPHTHPAPVGPSRVHSSKATPASTS